MRLIVLLLLALSLILTGCGDGNQPDVRPEADNTPAESVETEDLVVEEPVEVIEEIVFYPEGTLDPAVVQDGDLVSVTALSNSFFAWEGKEVTLAAYPYIWYGDSVAVESELKLVIDPDGTEDLARVKFDVIPELHVHRGEIIALTGTFEFSWFGPELNAAIFADPPSDLTWIETSPHIYNGEPIPVDQFAEICNPWTGREVIVQGYYNSTTTSTTDYGVTIRVDLADPDNTSDKLVACEMAQEIPEEVAEAMAANRNGVQIRGTVADESFNMVGLENCAIVNR